MLKCAQLTTGPALPEYDCAEILLRWGLLESFRGRILPVKTIREKFVNDFNARWKGLERSPAYWKGIRAGNSASKRIYIFLHSYEVLKPIEPYELSMKGDVIRGVFALVRKRTKRPCVPSLPMILEYHSHRPLYYQQPTSLEILRYMYLMQATEYPDAGVYHLPLFRGRPWTRNSFDLPLVQHHILSILGIVNKISFPSPGSHCEICKTKDCLMVFNV